RSFGAARPANARGELIRSCTVRSWTRRIRLCGHFPYRPTIGDACGMYRPPIGPVSAIERAIVCMRMPRLADLRQPISRGVFHTATSGGAPGFFYARCARNQVDRRSKDCEPVPHYVELMRHGQIKALPRELVTPAGLQMKETRVFDLS